MPDPFTEFTNRAGDLLYEGVLIFRQSNDEIVRTGTPAGRDPKHALIARLMLMDSLTLAGEIVDSLRDRRLLLSLIGVRSLFEAVINVAYIYSHPDHKKDDVWISNLCEDFLKRANDPRAQKSQLGGVSMAKRGGDVKLELHYADTIGGLSNFSHMLGFAPTQNDPAKTELMYRAAYLQTLTSMLDIYQVLQHHFNLQPATAWQEGVASFAKNNAVNFNG